MYADRMKILVRAYTSASKSNIAYNKALEQSSLQKLQIEFLEGMHAQLHAFVLSVIEQESLWREAILSSLETEIVEALSWVYPTDGYQIGLTSSVSRGKIHIDAKVSSIYAQDLPGRIRNTQGRLFQQVVSFAALFGVMSLLGIKTVYIDEAFSGSSRKNIRKLNSLLSHMKERGFNLVLIAQDTTMADGISANRLFLRRTLDNKTEITQEVVV